MDFMLGVSFHGAIRSDKTYCIRRDLLSTLLEMNIKIRMTNQVLFTSCVRDDLKVGSIRPCWSGDHRDWCGTFAMNAKAVPVPTFIFALDVNPLTHPCYRRFEVGGGLQSVVQVIRIGLWAIIILGVAKHPESLRLHKAPPFAFKCDVDCLMSARKLCFHALWLQSKCGCTNPALNRFLKIPRLEVVLFFYKER